jgi:hypothetical protein
MVELHVSFTQDAGIRGDQQAASRSIGAIHRFTVVCRPAAAREGYNRA